MTNTNKQCPIINFTNIGYWYLLELGFGSWSFELDNWSWDLEIV